MKTLTGTVICVLFFATVVSVFAQGTLTPPGAPSPTMKTLDQIQPRTPISSVPITISSAGSYYLTKNVNVTTGDAITITANNVTLDLNGFTISSTKASAGGTAILLSGGPTNISILNGQISSGVTQTGGTYSGSGFANGVLDAAFNATNIRVRDISISGVLTYGIYLTTTGTVVESCTVRTAGSYGIIATSISNSNALNCGILGILARSVINCYGESIGSAEGIQATNATNCSGFSASGNGIYAATAINCYGESDSGYGLTATNATNCYGRSNSGSGGLNALNATSCYGLSTSAVGLNASTASGCYGNSGSNIGLTAANAENCYGYSGSNTGLYANTASNSYGESTNANGLFVNDIAIGCRGKSGGSGVGLSAYIANSCRGTNTSGTSVSYTYHYNMPPP